MRINRIIPWLIYMLLIFAEPASCQFFKDTSYTIISTRYKKEIAISYRYLQTGTFIQTINIKGKKGNLFVSNDTLFAIENSIYRKNNARTENYLVIKSFLDFKSEFSRLNHDGIFYTEEIRPISFCSSKKEITFKYKLIMVDAFINLEHDFTYTFDIKKMRIVEIE
jgi:hypothetical protein